MPSATSTWASDAVTRAFLPPGDLLCPGGSANSPVPPTADPAASRVGCLADNRTTVVDGRECSEGWGPRLGGGTSTSRRHERRAQLRLAVHALPRPRGRARGSNVIGCACRSRGVPPPRRHRLAHGGVVSALADIAGDYAVVTETGQECPRSISVWTTRPARRGDSQWGDAGRPGGGRGRRRDPGRDGDLVAVGRAVYASPRPKDARADFHSRACGPRGISRRRELARSPTRSPASTCPSG